MKKNLCFVVLLAILGQKISAQDSLDRKHLIVKIAPLAMFDIDNTFEFAAEHRLNKKNRWTLSEQVGYGAGVANIWGENNAYNPQREHYRAKLEARRYSKAKPDMTGYYMGYEVFYKQVNDQLNKSVGRECESGPCNYYENLDYPVTKYVLGTTVKVGYQVRFRDEDKKKTNFVFDIYVGLGLRRIMIDHKVDIQNYGSSFYYGESWFGGFGSRDNAYNIPHASFGLRFGYILY